MKFLNNRVFKILRRIQKFGQTLEGRVTLGARVLVINERDEVLMVKHTYTPGWYLPGGGVNRHETPFLGMVREAWEEAGVYIIQAKLIATYFHKINGVPDHVFFFKAGTFNTFEGSPSPEIEEKKWWPLNSLPVDMARTTKQWLNMAHAVPVRADKRKGSMPSN